jgi:hypothetical protein
MQNLQECIRGMKCFRGMNRKQCHELDALPLPNGEREPTADAAACRLTLRHWHDARDDR